MLAAGLHDARRSPSPMTEPLSSLPEWHGVTRERFEQEIVPRAQPAILRGVVAGWPAVAKARESALAVAQYLAQVDNGTPVDAIMGLLFSGGSISSGTRPVGFGSCRLSISSDGAPSG